MNPRPARNRQHSDGAFRVVPRAEHAISRKNISPGALRTLYRLHEAGYRACLVGGAVRDLLLGRHPKDFDVATDATPEEVRELFRNCRLIGRRFRLAHVVFGREIVEVATFRGSDDDGTGDRCLVDGRLVRDNVYGSIEEDALRRDFTINALYYDIADFSVRDAAGGMADLQARVLRLIGDPEQRYREDPVRMLRAARIAAKLGFTIDPATAAPFRSLAPLLREAPPARLFDETMKLFMNGYGLASFRELERHGLLEYLLPATAQVLADPATAAHVRGLVEATLESTDERVRADQPVTPAFLFAAFLWEPLRRMAARRIERGEPVAQAWVDAADDVLREQARRVAIPRRFTLVTEEIWMLQRRLAQSAKRRVGRMLAHPRFRAAHDFLLLRAEEAPDVAALGAWWTRAQQAEGKAGDDPPATAEEAAAPAAAPRKRPRRRRKRTAAAGQPEGE